MKNGQHIALKQKQSAGSSRQKPTKSNQAVSPNFQQVLDSPQAAAPEDVLRLQEAAGNSAVTGWLQARAVQPEPVTDSSGTLNGPIASAIQSARGKGQPLPADVQRDMEGHLQADFSGVQLHTGSQADTLSRQIHARAFTIGSDIFFRRGAYAPGAASGQRTLRHELMHVIQQNGSAPSGSLKLGAPDTVQEQQAAQAAQSNWPSGLVGSAPAAVQRLIDYKSIALAFGGSVTEAMVEAWTRTANPEKEAVITTILLGGKNIDQVSQEMLKLYGVNVDKMLEDLKNSGAQVQDPPQVQEGVPPMPARPAPSISAQLARPLPPLPPLPEKDVRARVLQVAQEEQMPSGALLDAIKDVGKGDLSKVSASDIKEVVALFKARNFNGLTAKGVLVEHIVAFTSSYERKGVGEGQDTDRGILGTI